VLKGISGRPSRCNRAENTTVSTAYVYEIVVDERGSVKAAKRFFLNPVGDHSPQQVGGEMLLDRASEHRLPVPLQRRAESARTRAISAAIAAGSTNRCGMSGRLRLGVGVDHPVDALAVRLLEL
jgi:hypothetical protein